MVLSFRDKTSKEVVVEVVVVWWLLCELGVLSDALRERGELGLHAAQLLLVALLVCLGLLRIALALNKPISQSANQQSANQMQDKRCDGCTCQL